MTLWDVNLWVYAFRADSPFHELSRLRLTTELEGRESFIFCPSVASSFLRLVTNPRIFKCPSSVAEAWSFIDWLEAHPSAVFADADEMTFGIWKHLCLVAGATGNAVPDAYLAAIALRNDATLLTMEAGMKRWAGVSVEVLASV